MTQQDLDLLPIDQGELKIGETIWITEILDCRMQQSSRLVYDIKFSADGKESRYLSLIIAAEALHVFNKQPEIINVAGAWLENTDERNGVREFVKFSTE